MCFVECPTIVICLMFSHETRVIGVGEKDPRGKMPLPSYQINIDHHS